MAQLKLETKPANKLLEQTIMARRIQLTALALFVSGVFFALYPAIRPFSDEASMQGAVAFASEEWTISHVLAIAAFILFASGMLGLYLSLQRTAAESLAFQCLWLSWIGIGLTLPFYGAEVFSLSVVGQEAIRLDQISLMGLANEIRFGPGFVLIVAGLLLLAAGTITAAASIWKSHIFPRWSGIPLAVGFLFYLPQYVGNQPIRVAHGLLIAFGCAWLASSMWRHTKGDK